MFIASFLAYLAVAVVLIFLFGLRVASGIATVSFFGLLLWLAFYAF